MPKRHDWRCRAISPVGWLECKPWLNCASGCALGILLDKRSPDYPDLPTFKEQGYPLTSIGWGGLIVPKGTPAATVDQNVLWRQTAVQQQLQTPL